MVTSCFFCQNLLSDYLEGILPSSRQKELQGHLESCPTCADAKKDLQSTLGLLHAIPARPLGNDMALRISEASHSGRARHWISRARVSQLVLFLAVPTLVLAAMFATFPTLFPYSAAQRFPASTDDSQFVKYSPLAQGAAEIVDEQATWLQARQPLMRSVWEEGGLSPDEFEQAFDFKSGIHGKHAAAPEAVAPKAEAVATTEKPRVKAAIAKPAKPAKPVVKEKKVAPEDSGDDGESDSDSEE
jgi:hypothetical protein